MQRNNEKFNKLFEKKKKLCFQFSYEYKLSFNLFVVFFLLKKASTYIQPEKVKKKTTT